MMTKAKTSPTDTPADKPKGVLDDLAASARRAVEGAEGNPVALLAGGLALGVIAGALLPRSDKERELLAPVGQKIGTSVTAAIDAAREAGKAELADAGIGRDAARDQARSLLDGLIKAATSAGTAAAQAASGKTDA